MQFNSIPFLVFLPLVFAVYWALGRRAQNLFLIAASYLFYGWWDWRFLGLIFLSSLVDFVAGRAIETRRSPRAWLGVSLAVNLGALGVFKYLDFGIESFARLLAGLGFEPHLETLSLILPVGISFYTFQTLSYTIDVYRGRIRATGDPVAFFAFVAFFPQLVAGPIERAGNLLPQFLRERRFDPTQALDGALQMLYGLWLKTVVADGLAPIADAGFSDPATGSAALVATYAFAFQIYGDFAGYSHIGIGCARMFGFSLMQNFACPYFSRNPREFWQRWHISLSTWFRDYVYIPLGGSRRGRMRNRINVLVTFGLSGLWHGAGLNFIAWGIYHGLLLLGDRVRSAGGRRERTGSRGATPAGAIATLVTFHLVCLGWIFFRSPDLAHAWTMIRALGGGWSAASVADGTLLWIPLLLAVEGLRRGRSHPLDLARSPAPVRWAACGLLVLAIVLFGRVDVVPFIYFQF